MKNTFPLDDTRSAACCRAEAVLSLYSKAESTADWQDMLTGAIADLAILSESEAAVSRAEAMAEGDPSGYTGMSVENACEEGAALARELLDEERRQADRESGGLYDEVVR